MSEKKSNTKKPAIVVDDVLVDGLTMEDSIKEVTMQMVKQLNLMMLVSVKNTN